ncbi:hypothetical protein B0H13DRAFT_1876444 [Mycena leptocephala]|nr:hypothetical protein B0H13DRAFT_1876444 [Mycena leptocephala]
MLQSPFGLNRHVSEVRSGQHVVILSFNEISTGLERELVENSYQMKVESDLVGFGCGSGSLRPESDGQRKGRRQITETEYIQDVIRARESRHMFGWRFFIAPFRHIPAPPTFIPGGYRDLPDWEGAPDIDPFFTQALRFLVMIQRQQGLGLDSTARHIRRRLRTSLYRSPREERRPNRPPGNVRSPLRFLYMMTDRVIVLLRDAWRIQTGASTKRDAMIVCDWVQPVRNSFLMLLSRSLGAVPEPRRITSPAALSICGAHSPAEACDALGHGVTIWGSMGLDCVRAHWSYSVYLRLLRSTTIAQGMPWCRRAHDTGFAQLEDRRGWGGCVQRETARTPPWALQCGKEILTPPPQRMRHTILHWVTLGPGLLCSIFGGLVGASVVSLRISWGPEFRQRDRMWLGSYLASDRHIIWPTISLVLAPVTPSLIWILEFLVPSPSFLQLCVYPTGILASVCKGLSYQLLRNLNESRLAKLLPPANALVVFLLRNLAVG